MKAFTTFSLAVCLLAGCATTPEVITTEHKGKTLIVHHRSRTGNGARDKIEAISANGSVSVAEIHVYDVGRYVDSSGDVHEAHKVYRTVQSERPNLMLPKKVSAGPRTAYAPPNYSPPPASQRITDAVDEAKEAKKKLDQAREDIQKRLEADNNLRGELQQVENQNQILQDQLNAAMATPHKVAPNDAEKAAANSASDLQKWGQNINQQ